MPIQQYNILMLAAMAMSSVLLAGEETDTNADQVAMKGKLMVSQLLEQHLAGCHHVFVTTAQHSYLFSSLLRRIHTRMGTSLKGVVVVDAGSVLSQEQMDQDQLLQGLWGDTRTTCRALILHLTNNNNSTNLALRLMKSSGLWQRPETRVVVVGGRAGVEAVLLHPSLRNTLHALYLATHHLTLTTIPRHGASRLRKDLQYEDSLVSNGVQVYRRCLYCNNGQADVQLITIRNLTSLVQHSGTLLNEHLQDLGGHELRGVALPYFPYMDFRQEGKERGGVVIPRDSLDVRILNAFADALNFSYKILAEPNRSFGDEKDGIFTGMIGQLQREESDFSTIVAPTPGRLKVAEFLRGYPADMMVVTSLKPALLPAHLALIRPFAGELWLALLLSVVGWSVLLWLVQRAWRWAAGGPGVGASTTLLYGWGALLDQPPSDPSVNTSGQVLVGWWLVFCLVITTGFRSSLIAHLTVQGRSGTLDSFQDLVEQDGWRWGAEPWLYSGAAYEYFSKHTDPVVKEIHDRMEVLVVKEALQKVLSGGFSFISVKNYVTVIVTSLYTEAKGETPFYISNKGFYILACFGWGVRKGAPFYHRFGQLMSRLEAGGIIGYWTEEVIARRVRDNRRAAALDPRAGQGVTQQESSEVALGLHHLQGAFYLLLLGCGVAFLTLLGENLAHSRYKTL